MFRVTGIVAIYGFARYGLAKYIEQPMIKAAINPEAPGEANASAASA